MQKYNFQNEMGRYFCLVIMASEGFCMNDFIVRCGVLQFSIGLSVLVVNLTYIFLIFAHLCINVDKNEADKKFLHNCPY